MVFDVDICGTEQRLPIAEFIGNDCSARFCRSCGLGDGRSYVVDCVNLDDNCRQGFGCEAHFRPVEFDKPRRQEVLATGTRRGSC